MKKLISVVSVIFLIICSFSACGKSAVNKSSKLSVVTTIFPEYDFVLNILGDKKENTDVTLLLDNGVDLHSYQPTADDIINISLCDVFIYVGGESDEWVEDALEDARNKDMQTVNLLEVMGNDLKEEETVEGMQAEDEDDEDEDETEYDEHVWLSLKNSQKAVNAIKDALIIADAENAAVYTENAENYIKKLKALDSEYIKATENTAVKTLLFADRFPFRYLTDDYSLDYYAAFKGCSAESEASFETIAFLAKKLGELGLKSVITLEGSDNKIAQTVIKTSKLEDIKILSLNSMQSLTSKDVKNGVTYLSVMEKNLEVLKEALE